MKQILKKIKLKKTYFRLCIFRTQWKLICPYCLIQTMNKLSRLSLVPGILSSVKNRRNERKKERMKESEDRDGQRTLNRMNRRKKERKLEIQRKSFLGSAFTQPIHLWQEVTQGQSLNGLLLVWIKSLLFQMYHIHN